MAANTQSAIPLQVALDGGAPLRFENPFRIGRDQTAGVRIQHEFVSRNHAEVFWYHDQWWIRDLQSANGIFVNNQRVPQAPIGTGISVRLGVEGPFVHFRLIPPPPPPPPPAPREEMIVAGAENSRARDEKIAALIGRYVEGNGAAAGEHTILLREAFSQVQRKQKRRYGWMIAAVAVVALAAGLYAWRLHRVTAEQLATARDLFYSIKSLDVDIGRLESIVAGAHTNVGDAELERYRQRRQEMEKTYDRFLKSLQIYDEKLSPRHRLALRVARIFGESEIDAPKEFLAEIDEYIGRWQRSDRLARALDSARRYDMIPVIKRELRAQGLPPQFFYLAVQESTLDPYISGPPTRSGIAKGLWQFVPPTALKYSLTVGPLAASPVVDRSDDRHDWQKETKAAAAYLKDLYNTEAQASGLLVMASYNWGEDRVLPLVHQLPANPKDRNFWRLLALGKNRIPKETYDYVFYIASAAVIGENPRLFGFDFDNPLATTP